MHIAKRCTVDIVTAKHTASKGYDIFRIISCYRHIIISQCRKAHAIASETADVGCFIDIYRNITTDINRVGGVTQATAVGIADHTTSQLNRSGIAGRSLTDSPCARKASLFIIGRATYGLTTSL